MDSGLGAELPPRTGMVWALAGFAVLCLFPVTTTAWEAVTASSVKDKGAGAAMAIGMLVLFVVLPLLLARHLHGHRFLVSSDAVTWVQGGEVRQRMAFDDVEHIEKQWIGSVGLSWRNRKVTLTGTLDDGSPGTLIVSQVFTTDVTPLLERLKAEAAERPEILSPDERKSLEAALHH